MLRAVVLFVAITYALSIGFSLAIGVSGRYDSPLVSISVITMFFPAAALLAVITVMNEPALINWRVFPIRYLPLALFLMPVVMHAFMLTMTIHLTGGLPWQAWLTPQPDGRFHTPPELGWGTLTRGGLGLRIILNAVAGLGIVSLLAFFEEIGWRAWLLPRLMQRMGSQKAIAAVAAIWALWHVPFVLSGITHLAHVPMLSAALILPLGDLGAGMVIGWVWVRTESIWIVCVAHGALNNWGQYAFKFMQDQASVSTDRALAPFEASVLTGGSLALFLVGVALLAVRTRRDPPALSPLPRC
jgi:membrane protease YdiL (CAAX protease family)